MKNSSKKIITVLILFLSLLVFSMIPVTAAVANTPQMHVTNDESVEIEAKFKKASTIKVTFNANGGTIGTKKSLSTNIKKGSAIKKFPATPKRTGYTFEGWYNKKNGGKKISANVKPTKSITLYAKWTKKPSSGALSPRTLNAEEKKYVGTWVSEYDSRNKYQFNEDGSYSQLDLRGASKEECKGFYSVKNGAVTLKDRYRNDFGSGWGSWSSWRTETFSNNFKIHTDNNGKQYFGNLEGAGRFFKV